MNWLEEGKVLSNERFLPGMRGVDKAEIRQIWVRRTAFSVRGEGCENEKIGGLRTRPTIGSDGGGCGNLEFRREEFE
jgi:hypothetical protein